MQRIFLTKGTIASGKTTWAESEVKKNPEKISRINRDSLRNMMNGYVMSDSNEKLITKVRDAAIIASLKSGRDVIVDETGKSPRVFVDICKIVKSLNIDCIVLEKPFYVDLETSLERNSKREGTAKIPEDIVRKFWKEFGGVQHKHYHAKMETFYKNSELTTLVQDENLPRAVIFDNDGTISLIHKDRSPYDASTCDLDLPHEHVIECMKLYFKAGYKILFVSGREDKDRAPTERFYKQYFPEVKYELFMRKTGDMRKDVLIKEEIFNNYIKDKYYVAGWFDDRLQVSKWVYENGLPLFRVNDPEATF